MNDKNRAIFESVRDHLNKADLSASEQFDKAVLTLSTAGLGFSVALTRYIVPLESAAAICLLVVSWLCFAAAIISTVVSFLTSRSAIRDTRSYAHRYYMEGDDKFADRVSPYSRVTYVLNFVSGFVFIIAILLTIAFATINVSVEGKMTENNDPGKSHEERGYVPPPADSGGKPEKQGNQENQESEDSGESEDWS